MTPKRHRRRAKPELTTLPKAATGIAGFDEITGGGLPAGRPTLVCGSAGCGKTLFAMEFIVRGATQFDEPGVFMAFEETEDDLSANVGSLGFDVASLVEQKKLFVDHVRVERSEIEETGEYNLDGLFIRLAHAIATVNAKRVVLDTLESLFASFDNAAILRAELRRLFGWLKERGLTTVITGERGDGQLTRQGLEEYVSDCVILLDQRVTEQLSTRRLRIVKYRGTSHGTNEYPFLIDEDGLSILPITSLGLTHKVSNRIVSTGIAGLDEMFGMNGIYRGSSVLVSGPAGTGKSILTATLAAAAGRRGERCLIFAYEESEPQIVRNMRSVGVDLQPLIDAGLLRIHPARPWSHGLEQHLVEIHKEVDAFAPELVAIDPISNLSSMGSGKETMAMLVRVVDFLKGKGMTTVCTSLTPSDGSLERTEIGLSSLVDAWLLLRQVESSGERNRTLFVLKARGMSHSNQVREFLVTDGGLALVDAYIGAHGVLTGSARLAQEAADREHEIVAANEASVARAEIVGRQRALEAERSALDARLAVTLAELTRVEAAERERQRRASTNQDALSRSRQVRSRQGGAARAREERVH